MNHSSTPDCFEGRRQRLVQALPSLRIDAILVTNLPNVRYLTNFSGSHAVLWLTPQGGVLISDGRYTEQIASEVSGLEIEIQGARKELDVITEVVGVHAAGTDRVGVEADATSHARYEAIAQRIAPKVLVSTNGAVERLRQTKDEGEIERIRSALAITENAIAAARTRIVEGMTERELAHEIEHRMWLLGAEKESFESLVLFGERSSLPHGKPGERKLRPGDIILTDVGCVLGGYCSDITRTCCFAYPPQGFEEAYAAVVEAVQRTEAGLHAGMTGREADALARDSLAAAGRGYQFIHSTGHGVGIEIHEAPRLALTNEETLNAGELVTVEPGVYVEGWGGIRVEDMVVVRENGCERLNKSSTALTVIDA